jgi:hypothetical protein
MLMLKTKMQVQRLNRDNSMSLLIVLGAITHTVLLVALSRCGRDSSHRFARAPSQYCRHTPKKFNL